MNAFPDDLPRRAASRPRTTNALPHLQTDQFPPRDILEELFRRSLSLEHVRKRESRMAIPGAVALCIRNEAANGPAECFIDDHEFCHLHLSDHGTIHLTLPPETRGIVCDRAWAEPHILAKTAMITQSLVLVYAPVDEIQLEIVCQIIGASLRYARGTNVLHQRCNRP